MTGQTRLRAAVGTSQADDGAEAGATAATSAVEGLHGERPALVIVYASVRYELSAVLRAVRDAVGDALTVGATSSGQMVDGSFVPMGQGVAVLAMTAGPYRFGTAAVSPIGADLDAAGVELAQAAQRSLDGPHLPHAALLLLTAAFGGDQQDVVRGIHRVAGARVPIVGGAAGDDLRFSEMSLLHGDEVLHDAAVAVWIEGERPFRVVTGHGWRATGTPLIVTGSRGGRITEIGGRPALAVYREQLGTEVERLEHEPFFMVTMGHPLGLLQPDGSTVIRVIGDPEAVGEADPDSLVTNGPVPEGSAVQVMGGSAADLLAVVPDLARAALEGVDNAGALLAFSCGVRQAMLGPEVASEARLLQDAAGDVTTFGFYTYGEFARTRGVLGFHTASLAAIAL
jgi:hypothetical protein